MRHKVLFVDDEKYFSGPFVRELSKSFDVQPLTTARAAVEAIRRGTGYAAIVLDIMMLWRSAAFRGGGDLTVATFVGREHSGARE